MKSDSFQARKKHLPFMWVTIIFASGIVFNEWIQLPFAALWMVTVLTIAAWLLFINRPIFSLVLLIIAFFFLGALISQNYQTLDKNNICDAARYYYGKPVVIRGVIVSDIEEQRFGKAKKTVFKLQVKSVKADGIWVQKKGLLLVNLFRAENINYGDDVEMEGKLHRPFEFAADSDFSYRDYLKRKGIEFILSVKKQGYVNVIGKDQGNPVKSCLFKFKDRLNGILEKHFSGAELGIMQGFLLGDRFNIPKQINEIFRLSGVIHILAISGFNVGIVSGIIFLFLKMLPIGRKFQYFLTMGILILYAILTGAQPPVVRATIMAVVFMVSFIIEKEPEPLNTLSCAALIILLINPMNIFDVGFQLSFISVLSIIIFYSRFVDIFLKLSGFAPEEDDPDKRERILAFRDVLWKYIVKSSALSLAAYLGVAVLVAYYFHLVTPIVVVANLVVIPLASIIDILGIALLLAGLIVPMAAFLFTNCIKVLMAFMVWAVFLFVQIPGAHFSISSMNVWVVIGYYGIMITVVIMMNFKRSNILSGSRFGRKDCLMRFDK